jgi:signal peptidase II
VSLRTALGVAAAVFAADRATKWWVVEALDLPRVLAIDVLPGVFALRMAWNRGVNFGLFASGDDRARWALVGLALVIAAAVAVWTARRADTRFGLAAGMLIGGAVGNAWDRVEYGAVADYLHVSCCGVHNPWSFNIADVAIFVGAIAIALLPTPEPRRA